MSCLTLRTYRGWFALGSVLSMAALGGCGTPLDRLSLFTKNAAGPVAQNRLVAVSAGEFLYGPGKEPVVLPAFEIDRSEVTVAQYDDCVEEGDCSWPAGHGLDCNFGRADRLNHPVNCVDWNQAAAYCKWAGKRLPTEQEWEKAARGTDGRPYPWGGEEPRCELAVIRDGGSGCSVHPTWPVCSMTAGNSPYGLCDTAGNVWEWTATCDSESKECVRRGGSGSSISRTSLRTDNRATDEPDEQSPGVGFRCAK